ncbi:MULTISPECIES: hypothetical protein [Enterobacterales]|uniref:hypothetical protein n=1 Tax=Enterobacterales TaxID=91347 RepID=UPI002EDA8D0B
MSYRPQLLLLLLLLLAGDAAGARQTFIEQAEHPFDNAPAELPSLGMAADNHESEKHLAEVTGSQAV